jgi:hypothetical protein
MFGLTEPSSLVRESGIQSCTHGFDHVTICYLLYGPLQAQQVRVLFFKKKKGICVTNQRVPTARHDKDGATYA